MGRSEASIPSEIMECCYLLSVGTEPKMPDAAHCMNVGIHCIADMIFDLPARSISGKARYLEILMQWEFKRHRCTGM